MKIHNVHIKNFKSYKDEFLNELNPKMNIILGRNGQGKSNFFNAISFLLTDTFNFRTANDKALITHNGLTRENDKEDVYVEIHFDNRKRRISNYSEYIKVRRTWTSSGKDLYTVNDKTASMWEITDMFERCGISRQKPYNIVDQGKITKMAHMREEELYELLQEVTGIKQYESKKLESLKMLEETLKDKKNIKELLDEVRNKFEDLKLEKDSFQSYEDRENSAKCLEYCLYQVDMNEMQERLEKLEEVFSEESNSSLALRSEKLTLEKDLQNLQNDIKEFVEKRKSLSVEEENLIQEVIENKKNLEGLQREHDSLVENEAKNASLKQKIVDLSSQAKALLAKIIENRAVESSSKKIIEKLEGELQGIQRESNEILLKQYNSANFKSVLERNGFLSKKITEFEEKQRQIGAVIKTQEKSLSEQSQQIQGERTNLAALKQTLDIALAQHIDVKKKLNSLKIDLIEKQNSLREANIKHSVANTNHKDREREYKTLETRITKLHKGPTPLTMVERYFQQGDLTGFYGVLIDFVKFDAYLDGFLDITLREQLFSYMIDTPENAQKLLDLNRHLKGPLINIHCIENIKQIAPLKYNYPNSQEILVIRSMITPKTEGTYKPIDSFIIEKLIDEVFSRYIITKTYDMALVFAKEFHLDCISHNKEIVYAGGYLTRLGFTDDKESKENAISIYKEAIPVIESMMEEAEKIKDGEEEIKKITQEEDDLQREILKYTSLEQELSKKVRLHEEKLKETEASAKRAESKLKVNEDRLAGHRKDLSAISAELEGYKKEKASHKIETLSASEEERLLKLENLILEQNSILKSNSEQLVKTENDIFKANLELDKIQNEIEACTKEERSSRNDNSDIYVIARRIKDLEDREGKNKVALKKYQDQRKVWISNEEKAEKNVENLMKQLKLNKTKTYEVLEKLNELKSKKRILNAEKSACIEKKGNIEFHHASLISQYSQMDKKEILRRLEDLRRNEAKKYTAKDRLLFEKLDTLKDKKNHFETRYEEIDKLHTSTLDVIEKLDKKSQDTISTVFPNLCIYFNECFQKIVPGGMATMKLVKVQGTSEASQSRRVLFNGIDIRVYFFSEDKENNNPHTEAEKVFQKMSKLSAGQKTVIAIALILAFQKLDPAPFYIFDEIDAALDTQYRRNIALILSERTNAAQYLISTFKPELLQIENSTFHEIKFENTVSHLKVINKEAAEALLQEQLLEES